MNAQTGTAMAEDGWEGVAAADAASIAPVFMSKPEESSLRFGECTEIYLTVCPANRWLKRITQGMPFSLISQNLVQFINFIWDS